MLVDVEDEVRRLSFHKDTGSGGSLTGAFEAVRDDEVVASDAC